MRGHSPLPRRVSDGLCSPGPDVAGDAVGLLDGHEEPVALGVGQLQVLALDTLDAADDEAVEAGDAVLDVDDVVARVEVGDEGRAVAAGLPGERGAA